MSLLQMFTQLQELHESSSMLSELYNARDAGKPPADLGTVVASSYEAIVAEGPVPSERPADVCCR